METPKASIIILSFNGLSYLGPCLGAVLKQDYPNFEVIVVDNASTDGSAEFVAENFPQINLIQNTHNLGFAGGNNIGLKAADGDVLILLNQDTVVKPGWLNELVQATADKTVGLVGCKTLYPHGLIQHAGGRLIDNRGTTAHIGLNEADEGQYEQPQDVDFVSAVSIALSRDTLNKIGLLDEDFSPAYYEDVDWCYRTKEAGLRVVYWPQATLVHYESTSTVKQGFLQKTLYHHGRLRLLLKHKPLNWLLDVFQPAELAWLKDLGPTLEMMTVREAYMRLLLSLPGIINFRLLPDNIAHKQNSDLQWESLFRMLLSFRDNCITGYAPATDSSLQITANDARFLWDDLSARAEIKEHSFYSAAPIIGGLISAFRHTWNNVSTKWYVLPIIEQQNQFNFSVLHLLVKTKQDINKINQSHQLEIDQAIREINRLAAQVAQLEQKLEAYTFKEK